MFDYTDFFIVSETDPSYEEGKLIEDNIVDVILQKYKMILFTIKGDVLGEPNLGADLELLLHQTKVSAEYVENQIHTQISEYIPELLNMNYTLKVVFAQDIENYYDIMYIYFKIADYEVYAQFGKSIT